MNRNKRVYSFHKKFSILNYLYYVPDSNSEVIRLCFLLFVLLPPLPPHSSVQLLSRVQPFATPWTAANQAPLYIINSRSLLKVMSIKSVMPSNHLILCHPLLLPSIFPSIRVSSNESVLPIRWPKYWRFSFSINPSQEYSELISSRID